MQLNSNIMVSDSSNSNSFIPLNYTIAGRDDGFGAQYQALMSGIAYSKFKNYNYIHTPLYIVGASAKSSGHGASATELNDFIGIPNYPSKCNIDITEVHSEYVHSSNNPSKYYTDSIITLLRNYYYSTSKPVIGNIDIAIHIRRGDVILEMLEARYTSLSYYNKIIKFLNYKYPLYNIVIFSEGNIKDFNKLNGKNISFKLNKSITETFHSLVSAKILVMAKSSFSYSAAILNSNEIYYINFWHKPLKQWKIINKELIGVEYDKAEAAIELKAAFASYYSLS